MSIVPINKQEGTIWDPSKDLGEEFPFSLDLWDPFIDFPFLFPSFSREFLFPTFGTQTQIKWKETPKAHIFKAFFPGLTSDVLVSIDDDRMLQISTEDGNFMSKFKLPENAIAGQVKASMVNGLLTVTIAKENANYRPNVRVVEINEH